MISIRSARLGSRAPLASFSTQLRRHRAITRTAIAALSLAITTAVSAGGAAQAGLAPIVAVPPSILPVSVGVGVATGQAIELTFRHAMDRASVEAALAIAPTHAVQLVWSDDGRSVKLVPEGLWATDARYGIVVDETARNDAGALLGVPARFTFTTQTAPTVTDFGLHFVGEPAGGAAALDVRAPDAGPPPNTASGVSAETSIQVTFSAPVRREEAENAFLLSPAVPGLFSWSGTTLTYVPIERLTSNARYAVTLAGVHDLDGNPLGGDASFSFTTRAGAQLVQTTPAAAATGVGAREIALWFSQPLDPASAGSALRVTDASSNAALTGSVAWNATHTQLRFTPSRAFAAGHRFDVSLADGALDADGNAVTAGLTFTTKAAVKRVTTSRVGPNSSLVGYALSQVNSARQAYGLAPLAYSSAIEAVALAHAWDQMNYGYFSHTGRDGSTHEQRLRRAGLQFGWNGENQCYSYNGATTTTGKLDWCQSQFMSEPYPGVANHKGNILSTHYTKVGIGIAISGSKVIIVWDFTD